MTYLPVDGSEGIRLPFQIVIESLSIGILKASEVWTEWVSVRKANGLPWVDVFIEEGLRCVTTADGESTVVRALVVSGHASPLHMFFNKLKEPGVLLETVEDLAVTLIGHVRQQRIDFATAGLVWSVEVL